MTSLWLVLVLAQLPANHPPVALDGGAAPSAASLLQKLDATTDLKTRDKPFEIAASLGQLYLEQGRLEEAALFFEQAVAKGAALRTRWKMLQAHAPATASDTCAKVPLAEVTTRSASGDLRTAAACASSGIQSLVNVDVQLGHLAFVQGKTDQAKAAYARALATVERHPDARYARGALLLETDGDSLDALKQAQSDLRFFVTEAPTSPKVPQAKRLLERVEAAQKAGGLTALIASTPAPAPPPSAPALSPEMINAFQNTPRTADMEAGFAKTLDAAEADLAKGDAQKALDGYKQVMPYQPNNPRVRAGMAWSLVKLGKPMADRVWSVAAETPDALRTLADTLRKQGNAADADALQARLSGAK